MLLFFVHVTVIRPVSLPCRRFLPCLWPYSLSVELDFLCFVCFNGNSKERKKKPESTKQPLVTLRAYGREGKEKHVKTLSAL
jgi:hypothetical protein